MTVETVRVACYAGPGLARIHSGDPTPGSLAAELGPWLVLDSVTTFEPGSSKPELYTRATLVQRRDTLERVTGEWRRVPPDSLFFDEGTLFPPVNWRFRARGTMLQGEGILVHDVVTRENGVDRRHVSRWPVTLVRVPCAGVPLAFP